jgi:glycosyltransferase involved in cell wall biosynthesis
MHPDSPLVSVVIPTYGRPDTLLDAVRSVRDQTYDNIELIVVDDASPVPVGARVSEIDLDGVATVEVIRHEENRGANVARNSGIDAASGEYIAFLDDDDRWVDKKVARQIETFQSAGPETGVVYTGLKEEKPSSTAIKTPEWRGNVVKELLTGKTFGQFSALMIKSSVIDAAGTPDERFPVWQDREWFFRLAQHYEFEPIPEPLTIRTIGRDDQISENLKAKRDVAYPLFVEKHRDLAAEYGFRYERLFLASLRLSIGRTAVRCEEYATARKFFLLAFAAYPLYPSCYLHVLASVGGETSYTIAQTLNERLLSAGSQSPAN